MTESKLSFIEMQIEGTLGQTIELDLPSLCIAPVTFDPDDVAFARGELIGLVVDSEMLVKTDTNQPVVTLPAVRMNNSSRVDVPSDNPLQYRLCAVRHDFWVDHALAFEQTKYKRLVVGSTTATPPILVSTEVGFIHFNRSVQRRGLLTSFSQSLADLQVDRIHRAMRYTRHFSSHCCRQIHRNKTHQLAKISLADSRSAVVPILVAISASYRSLFVLNFLKPL